MRIKRPLGRVQGFTLLELMITIVIAAILVTAALPSFQSIIQNNRMATQANELLTAINLARSEVLKRGRPVAICHSANPGDVAPTCGGVGSSWSSGWLVFAVGPANTTSPRVYQVANDELLRVGEPKEGITVAGNGTVGTSMEYRPNGTLASSPQTSRFALCDNRGAASGRDLVIRPVGRSRIERPASDCVNPP